MPTSSLPLPTPAPNSLQYTANTAYYQSSAAKQVLKEMSFTYSLRHDERKEHRKERNVASKCRFPVQAQHVTEYVHMQGDFLHQGASTSKRS